MDRIAQNLVMNNSNYSHQIIKIMNKEEIKSKIKEIIVDKNGVSDEHVTDNANFETDLGMDSLDRIELMMEVEKEFKITILDDEAEKVHTLNDCVEIVDRAQHGSQG